MRGDLVARVLPVCVYVQRPRKKKNTHFSLCWLLAPAVSLSLSLLGHILVNFLIRLICLPAMFLFFARNINASRIWRLSINQKCKWISRFNPMHSMRFVRVLVFFSFFLCIFFTFECVLMHQCANESGINCRWTQKKTFSDTVQKYCVCVCEQDWIQNVLINNLTGNSTFWNGRLFYSVCAVIFARTHHIHTYTHLWTPAK